ncbi:hypothetical protein BBG20_05885 [Pseudomonas aylmerensis]|uniref:Uncharacterized protein n=1 Tax=Pseudomonas aylmerensis TaxID=1869229 RepID=A0ABX2YZV6_9PSED|nr:hypothetical protein BBG20_05885 [Pseudomonas aylmerensis]
MGQLPLRCQARPASDPGRQRLDRSLVNGFFQGFTGFETWFLGSSDLQCFASLWVTASASWAVSHRESTEAYQYYGVAGLQSASDGFDYCIQRTASSSFRDISGCSDSINQFRLVHSKSPYISIEYDSKFFGESKNQC